MAGRGAGRINGERDLRQGEAAMRGRPCFCGVERGQGRGGRGYGVAEVTGEGKSGAIGAELRGGLSASGKQHAVRGPAVHAPRGGGRVGGPDGTDGVAQYKTHADALSGGVEGIATLRGGLRAGIDASGVVHHRGAAMCGEKFLQSSGRQGAEGGQGEASGAAECGGEFLFVGVMAQVAAGSAGGRQFDAWSEEPFQHEHTVAQVAPRGGQCGE